MKIFNLKEFLESGIFFSCPQEKKIWCMYSEIKKYASNSNLIYPYFYFNDFYFSKQDCYYKGKEFFEFSIDYFLSIIEKNEDKFPEINWKMHDEKHYKMQYCFIQENINKNIVNKGVPFSSLCGIAELTNENKLYIIKNVLINSKKYDSYLYGFLDKNSGLIGATPELIFRQKNSDIYTIALAGTVKNDLKVNRQEFMNDEKILNEHNYVITGINNSLSKFGNLKIEPIQIFELPHLLHLKTDIHLGLNSKFNFLDMLHNLHPTPAVGFYPKSNVFTSEERIINFSYRKNFAAPFGLILSENISLCVCLIRGIQWNNNEVQISAGGGIIKESNYTSEFEEISAKINAIIKNLGLNYEF